MSMNQEEYREVRHDSVTQEQADRMSIEQQRIIKLEQRLWEAEGQLAVCLRFIRKMTEDRVEKLEQEVFEKIPRGEA